MKKYLILIFLLVVLSAVTLRSFTIRNDMLIFNGLDTGPVAKSWFAIHLAGGVIDTSGSCDTLMNWMFGDISNQFGVNANNSGMYSGFNNYVGDAFNVITGGQKDTIVSGATEVFMGGGYNNYMDAGGDHSGIISGKDNYCNSPDCFMGGGEDDTIGINSNSSGMVGGELNEIYEQYCFLGGGYNIEIFDGAEFSASVGSKNGIIQTPYSFGVGRNFYILGTPTDSCNFLFGTGTMDSTNYSVLFGNEATDVMTTDYTFGIGFWAWIKDSLYVIGVDTTKIFPNSIETGDGLFDVMVCVTSDTIASASPLVLTNHNNFVITGTADIDSIDQSCAFPDWAIAYIEFTGTAGLAGLKDTKNLKLAGGNFIYTPDDMIMLQRRGNIFYEISRSAN